MRWLYHVTPRGTDLGDLYAPASVVIEGFVHCSFRDEIRESALLYFPHDIALDVLRIDPRRLEARVELASSPRGPMPHVHGPIPRDAIAEVLPLDRVHAAPDRVTGTHFGFVAFEGMTLLDVAAGTGLVAVEGHRLIGPSGRLLALDPSPGMLAELRKKLAVETIEAYAESIPLPEHHVDFVSMGYALRHVGDLDLAFGEYHRVLRSGGRVCIMEISRPKSRLGQLALRSYISWVVPFLARLMRSPADVKQLWAYYGDTIELAIEPECILDAMRRAGFIDVECAVTFGVFREYFGCKA